MHRSGTSCLAGLLRENGVYFPSASENGTQYNAKGNQENIEVMRLNDRLLTQNQGQWNKPPDKLSWTEQDEHQRDRLLSRFKQSAEQQSFEVWGFKDPRCLLTHEFWLASSMLESVSCRLLGSFRHPFAVAHSLERRNAIRLAEGLDLWFAYNRRLLACYESEPFPLLCFDRDINAYKQDFENMLIWQGLCHAEVRSSFADAGLRQNTGTIKETGALPMPIMNLYNQLFKYYQGQAFINPVV